MGDSWESVRPRKLARDRELEQRNKHSGDSQKDLGWKDVEDHPVPTLLPPRCRVVWLEHLLAKTETKRF